jgi:hypothetical protein
MPKENKDIEQSQGTTVIRPWFRYPAREQTTMDFQKENRVLVHFSEGNIENTPERPVAENGARQRKIVRWTIRQNLILRAELFERLLRPGEY